MVIKRFLFLICCMGFLMACSDTEKVNNPTKEAEEISSEEHEEVDGIVVDKGLLHVELTIPADLFNEEEVQLMQEKFENDHEANIVQNDDASWTMRISKKEHKELMNEMKEEMIVTIDEIIHDEAYRSIKDITYDNHFTTFKMMVDEEVFQNSFDGFATLALGLTGTYYQVFSGKDITKDKVIIKIINDDSKEEIDELVYPDVLNEMNEEL